MPSGGRGRYMSRSRRGLINSSKMARAFGKLKRYSRMKKLNRFVRRNNTGLVANANTQILNKGKDRIYSTKRTYSQNIIIGAGVPVAAALQWNVSQFPDIGNLGSVFGQYKCKKLIYTFKLLNLEMTDNAVIPEIFIRYNDDPDLAAPNSASINNLRNVKRHFFNGNDLEISYTVYPKIIMAGQIYNTTGFTAVPRKAGWQDVDKTVGHYGLQYYIPNLPTGMSIEVALTAEVAFKEQW